MHVQEGTEEGKEEYTSAGRWCVSASPAPSLLQFLSLSLPFTQGPNGYDEMHKFVKQGEEFGKELETILAERCAC